MVTFIVALLFCGMTYSTTDASTSPLMTSTLYTGKSQGAYAAEYVQRAHSHNDYHQADPLSSALKHGLNSVEVDVFPRDDQLWVAHVWTELDSSRTINNLYIDPLLKILNRSGKATADPRVGVGKDRRPFPPVSPSQDDTLTLLVDLKGSAEKSVNLLQQVLTPLKPFLSHVDRNGRYNQGPVTVLISGNRPRDDILVSDCGNRYLFVDGREEDIHGNTDTNLVPMVSLSWRSLIIPRFLGQGESYMRSLAGKAHAQGKRLRIFGAPNREYLWSEMLNNSIDFLSIDDHARFRRFASNLRVSR
jgi:hypothetical protein